MPTPFRDHFSAHASAYARYRPTYPAALFAWLAEIAPGRRLAWDCATGNGQAAIGLAAHFERVLATDASAEQIAAAVQHERVEYRVATAEEPAIGPASIDLATVANGVHWFDRPRFWAACRHVLRPEGVVAVWAYDFAVAPQPFAGALTDIARNVVGAHWPAEAGVAKGGRYAELDFPFEEIVPPSFELEAEWTFEDAIGFGRTWSATRRYTAETGEDPFERREAALRAAWGEAERQIVRFPLHMRVGRR